MKASQHRAQSTGQLSFEARHSNLRFLSSTFLETQPILPLSGRAASLSPSCHPAWLVCMPLTPQRLQVTFSRICVCFPLTQSLARCISCELSGLPLYCVTAFLPDHFCLSASASEFILGVVSLVPSMVSGNSRCEKMLICSQMNQCLQSPRAPVYATVCGLLGAFAFSSYGNWVLYFT